MASPEPSAREVLITFFHKPTTSPTDRRHKHLENAKLHEGDTAFVWIDSDFGLGPNLSCVRWTRCIVPEEPPVGYLRLPESNAVQVIESEIIAALRAGKVEGPFPGFGFVFKAWGRYQPTGPTGPLVIIYMTRDL